MEPIIAKPFADVPGRPAGTGAGAEEGEATDVAEAGETLTLDAADGAGQRLDRYLAGQLAARLPGVSRTRVQQWIALGAVRCDDRVLPAKTRLTGRETIVVEPQPREADAAFAPDPVPLEVVAEDAALLVLAKPAGLVVHPGAGNWRGTLMNGLLYHRPPLAALPRAGIVHRLDRDTSGLMVVAKTDAAMQALAAQLADRSMGRRYLALVAGRCPAGGCIDAPIGRDETTRVRMAVVAVPKGRVARTFYRSLAFGELAGKPVTLVECRLQTGRTHQIRVHLRSIGHPLVGDVLYGGPPIDGFARQALHAWRLALLHPADGRPCAWQQVMPPDMRGLCERAGIDVEQAMRAAQAPFELGEAKR
ncbi:MAG: RluA family pseudouridine synthase [Burkholderiales bacterium]|nr:RluA family pseudouridine synthase [Burkholderiales bacterium]